MHQSIPPLPIPPAPPPGQLRGICSGPLSQVWGICAAQCDPREFDTCGLMWRIKEICIAFSKICGFEQVISVNLSRFLPSYAIFRLFIRFYMVPGLGHLPAYAFPPPPGICQLHFKKMLIPGGHGGGGGNGQWWN